jgi:hypothetical protein
MLYNKVYNINEGLLFQLIFNRRSQSEEGAKEEAHYPVNFSKHQREETK